MKHFSSRSLLYAVLTLSPLVGCGDDAAPGADAGIQADSATAADMSTSNDGGTEADAEVPADAAPDASTASAFAAIEGFWNISSIRIGENTFTDDGETSRVIGNARIAAGATPTTGTLSPRLLIVNGDGVPLSEPQLGEIEATISEDGDELTLNEDVFSVALAGTTLTLTRTSTGEADSPNLVVLERAELPPATLVGSWVITTARIIGTTIPYGDCIDLGDNYGEITQSIDFDEQGGFTTLQTTTYYSDSACDAFLGAESTIGTGMAVLDGTDVTIHMWLSTDGGNDAGAGTYEIDTSSPPAVTFTLDECAGDDCAQFFPTTMTVEPGAAG